MSAKRRRPTVAILDGDSRFCEQLARMLGDRCEVVSCATEGHLRGILAPREPDLLLFNVAIPGAAGTRRDGFDMVCELRHHGHRFLAVAMTDEGGLAITGRALREGIPCLHRKPPVDFELMAQAVREILDRERLAAVLSHCPRLTALPREPVTCPWPASRSGQRVLEQLQPLLGNNLPILFEGERGTGKRTTAHWVHRQGPTAARPFLVLDPSQRPVEVYAADLFGTEQGPEGEWRGALGAAEGSTIYLPEVEQWPPELVARLTEALRTGCYVHPATPQPLPVLARVMLGRTLGAGTTPDWDDSLRSFWHPFRVSLPPLRSRREDIPFHLDFLRRELEQQGAEPRAMNPAELRQLAHMDLPRNFHDLKMAALRGVDVGPGGETEAHHAESVWSRLAARPKRQVDDIVLMKYLRAVERTHGRNLQAWIEHTGYERATIYRWWSRLDKAPPDQGTDPLNNHHHRRAGGHAGS